MPEPTIEQLYIAALRVLGWTDLTPFQWELTHYRWKQEGRQYIFELEEKLLVADEDWDWYWEAFRKVILGKRPPFRSIRQATPEQCLRALHAIGKLEVKDA